MPQSRAGCGRCDLAPGEGLLGGAPLGLLVLARAAPAADLSCPQGQVRWAGRG
ncbi:hypothetical protein [Nannocystis exedens]|uniref:hypothetical protein n=1 Tax=Nannocystis exedens TaxID=54 RepID=UPI00147334DA|nr:hypothetical protein [Nannocystis exedens]